MPSFELVHPKELNADEWRQLQTLSRDSFGSQLNRSQEEIDTFTAWADPDKYRESRVKPNSEGFNPNQSYSSPRVAIASEGSDVVGFAYVANNVSGATKAERTIKMLGNQKKYLWFREAAVRPDMQRSGVGSHLARMILFSANPFQPLTAYTWPDEVPHMSAILRKHEFEPTGEQIVHPFGEEAAPARQVRMQAPSAYTVMKALNN